MQSDVPQSALLTDYTLTPVTPLRVFAVFIYYSSFIVMRPSAGGEPILTN